MTPDDSQLPYHGWKKKLNVITSAKNQLYYDEDTKELHHIYDRKEEIIEEILSDLAPQLSDSQYEGTTSWQYETELTVLTKRQEELEPMVEELIQKKEHSELLRSLNMTQEQFDAYNQELKYKLNKPNRRKK